MFGFVYITPERAAELNEEFTAAQWRRKVRHRKPCMNCDNQEWIWGGLGLCFACLTGETDASEDYEVDV